jgi:hypothetical protein
MFISSSMQGRLDTGLIKKVKKFGTPLTRNLLKVKNHQVKPEIKPVSHKIDLFLHLLQWILSFTGR